MGYKKIYQRKVNEALALQKRKEVELLCEEDICHLPEAVQKYIRFAGCVGKPKVMNMFIEAKGLIRSKSNDPWMKFRSEQYNFYPDYSRFFYIKARKAGIPVTGLHVYDYCRATMLISIAGLFRVVDAKGPEMDQGETVTVLNDMCFMAPATLIDPNIQWEEIDSLNVRAIFTNGNLRVSAVLTFAEDGRLVDFLSHDRFETSDGKKYLNHPWRTPVLDYCDCRGYILPYKADVIYLRPEGEFCYGKFELSDIRYNVL